MLVNLHRIIRFRIQNIVLFNHRRIKHTGQIVNYKMGLFRHLKNIYPSIRVAPTWSKNIVKPFVSFQFVNLRQPVGLLGRGISPTQDPCLHRTTQTHNKHKQTIMPCVGFEPTIQAFERAKAFHALNRAAIVLGRWED
jgi:hypothetical protein